MKKQQYIKLLFFLTVGIFGGCSTEGMPEETTTPLPDNLTGIRFNLTAAPEQVIQTDGDEVTRIETRAATNEVPLLQDLTVLQFDVSEGEATAATDANIKCVTSRWLRAPEPEQEGTEKPYYLIGLQTSQKSDQYLVFIANAGSVFQNFEGKSLQDFKAITIGLDQKTDSNEHQLMIASRYTPIGTVDKGDIYDIELQRLVAKVHFKYESKLNIVNSSFTPLALRLMNVPKILKYADGIEATTDYPTKEEANFENYTSIVYGIENGFTWYIPQNIRSLRGTATNPWDKTADKIESPFCTYVELSGIYKAPNMPDQLVSYKFYLGENTTDDYNVHRNHSYEILPVLKGVNSFDKRVTKRNLTLGTPANCFVLAPEAGSEVTFSPYQAPGTDVAASGVHYLDQIVEDQYSRITDVKVVWQTSSGLITAEPGEGVIRIQTNNAGTSGNALVAAYSGNTILWSWHVWVTPYAKVLDGTGVNGYIHAFGGYSWMDRNLGALNTDRNADNRSLYYQWGRKDPFYDTNKTSVIGTGISINNGETVLNIDKSIENPTAFFRKQTKTNTWHGGEAPLKELWQAGTKTVFDPCPAGWRVPEAACWNDYTWGDPISWDRVNPYGASLTISAGTYAWFPIGALNTSMTYDGSNCYMWSASWEGSSNSPSSYYFNQSSGGINKTKEGTFGGAVRCVKEN